MDAFRDIKHLSTRLMAALQSTDATKETIKDAAVFNRKLQGKRASSISQTPVDPNTQAPNTISASQQSYTQQIQHLSGLVAVLGSEASYTLNETDLQITNLQTMITDLTNHNNEVATAYAEVSNKRIDRNETLYGEEGSIIDSASEVKKYVKSIYGATSPQFAQIRGIQFRRVKY